MWAIAIAAVCFSSELNAQVRITINRGGPPMKMDTIDNAVFTAQYRMEFVADTANRGKKITEMMMLAVGSSVSLFHSYSKMVADSIIAEHLKAWLGMETLRDKLQGMSSQISYKIYKNYPSGKVTTLDDVAGNNFKCVENNEKPSWEIAGDTLSVLSYLCQKATCTFRGRNYTAWFSPEIAKSDGPWKLQGLPGLIMKAYDDRGEYSFECIGLVNSRDNQEILYGDRGYEPVSRSDFNKQMERFAADPIGYATSGNPNMKLVMKDESGQNIRPTNTPYNPIELSEK